MVLHRDAQPHIWIAAAPVFGEVLRDAASPLGQHEPVKIRSLADHIPQPVAHAERSFIICPVAETAAKYPLAFALILGGSIPPCGQFPRAVSGNVAGCLFPPVGDFAMQSPLVILPCVANETARS